jgi:hypothetical protein
LQFYPRALQSAKSGIYNAAIDGAGAMLFAGRLGSRRRSTGFLGFDL